jgi:intracellular septation protein A
VRQRNAIAAQSGRRVNGGSLPSASRRSPNSGPSAIVSDVLVPLALYYVLRTAGASVYLALLLGATAPALRTLAGLIASRTVDCLGTFMLTTLLVGVGLSLISGSPRFLLAKEAWVTAVTGGWFLISARGRRPLAFVFARALLEGRRVFTNQSWDALWERFHRTFRISSVIWGAGMLTDAALRVLIAYTLPVDVVPALTTALLPVSFVVIALIDQINYQRGGLRPALLGRTRADTPETRA